MKRVGCFALLHKNTYVGVYFLSFAEDKEPKLRKSDQADVNSHSEFVYLR